MFYLCYNILSLFLLLPVLVYHLYRSISRGRPPALAERFGFISKDALKKISGRKIIWLHAVSVGETIAARPLLKALSNRYPNHAILVSNTTETGRGVAFGFPEIDLCIYFPFDFLPAVRRILSLVHPEVVIIMETEIWPNFNREAQRLGIPLLLANGRISDSSFRSYLRFNWFFRNPLVIFAKLCMQTNVDSERVTAIGAPANHVITAGNLKYDIPFRQIAELERTQLRALYLIPNDLTVITAASTHYGEEQYVINSYLELIKTDKNLFLVLVPRHPERCVEVTALLEHSGISFRKRTELAKTGERFQSGSVLVVDTVGEMMNLYALSDIAFVGGSMVPTGGHNLLEPASLGIVCLFGPNMSNFREIAALVLQYRAGIQVETPQDLTDSCRVLLTNRDQRLLHGQNGLKMIAENGGATQRHMKIISEYL